MDPWDDQPDGLGADVGLAGPGGGRDAGDVALRLRRRVNGPRAHQLDLRGARAHIHALDVQPSRTSQARRCQPRCYRSKIASLGQSAFGCSARRDGQLHNSRNYRKRHGGDRGGEECRKSVRWERKGPGSAVDRLLDIFHFKITHLLVKIKFKYLCNATFVLMYYLVLHCVSSCLVLGRECNDLQVYPHLRNVRGICQTIAHHIVVFKPLCCSGCQSDLGWQLQDTGTR